MVNKKLLTNFPRTLVVFLALLSPSTVYAEPVLNGKKHPVQQLVEWELIANDAMTSDALNRMAIAVLENMEDEEIPTGVNFPVTLAKFKELSAIEKANEVAKLKLEDIKKVVLVPVKLKYLEIPQDQIAALGNYSSHELKSQIGDQVKNTVYFEKNGKPYVRWFLHPLSGAKKSEISKAIEAKFQYTPKPVAGDFKFNFTSSRSMVVFKKDYDDAISLKVSLPAAEGPFKNKQIHLKEYTAWTRHNSYLADLLPENSTENMLFLNEPVGLGAGVKGAEDAFLSRDLNDLPKRRRYYLPAFSMLDSETGAKIAALNGSDNPLKFWEKNFLEPMAKGLAELRAKTGAEHTSPHSQNIMVELDENMKPTGKVVLRDLDFYLDESSFDRFNRVVKDKDGLIDRRLSDKIAKFQRHLFSLRNGLEHLPSWMSEKDYGDWVKTYFSVFGDRYSEVTGIPKSHLDLNILKIDAYGVFSRVKNDNFIEGKHNNFHFVDLQGNAEFAQEYSRWLSRRREEIDRRAVKAVVAQVVPEPADPKKYKPELVAGRPVDSWDEALRQINDPNVDMNGFERSTEALRQEASKFDLKMRKNLNNQILNSRLLAKINKSGNPTGVIALLEAVNDLEPLLVTSFFKSPIEMESILKRAGASPDQMQKGKMVISNAWDYSKILDALKFGQGKKALEAAKVIESLDGVLRTSVADAFAYKINRTNEMDNLYELSMSLAKIGAGDSTVATFLPPKLKSLPKDHRDKVTAVLSGNNLNCETSYAAFVQ